MSGKSSFSEDLIGEFQEAFMLFDTKGDGMIPVRIQKFRINTQIKVIRKFHAS